MNEDLKALMILDRVDGFGIQKLKSGLEKHSSPAEVLSACRREAWAERVQEALDDWDPAAEEEKCRISGVEILGYGQEGYPKPLYEIYDPPMVLYARGRFSAENLFSIAIVGSRHPSHYGIETARRFGAGLAEAGITVVSGFAKGIDTEAHRGALEGRGQTVAVLGCGVDQVYPAENGALYRRILESGSSFISEYPLGSTPIAANFPRRNRLISGLSLAVLVVEAHEKSGSLITAQLALDQGKDVFAIPGRIDSLGSRGTNRLIKQGACLVESPEDLLNELKPVLEGLLHRKPETAMVPSEGQVEASSIEGLLRRSALSADQLIAQMSFSAERLMPELTLLEIRGKIKRLPDGKFALRDN